MPSLWWCWKEPAWHVIMSPLSRWDIYGIDPLSRWPCSTGQNRVGNKISWLSIWCSFHQITQSPLLTPAPPCPSIPSISLDKGNRCISPPLGIMGLGKEWKDEFIWKHSQSTLCVYSSLTQWIIPFMGAVASNITHCCGSTPRGSVSQKKTILGMHMPHGSWESWEPNKKPFFDH